MWGAYKQPRPAEVEPGLLYYATYPSAGLLVYHGGALARTVFSRIETARRIGIGQRLLYAPATAVVFHRHRRVQNFAVHGDHGPH